MVVDTVLGHREEQIVERAVLVEPVAAEPELHEDLLYDVFGGGMFPPLTTLFVKVRKRS